MTAQIIGEEGSQHRNRTPRARPRAAPPTRKAWLVPTGLVILSAVPVIAGAVRLAELSGDTAITPANARFFASPLPIVLHIVSVTLYALLGAFQFAPALRRGKRARWHRLAGRILIPSGLIAALSGLWMNQFYALPPSDGAALYILRLVFGWGMALSLVLGVAAIRRRDFAAHGDWMTRAYAIGMGAGTQVLTHLPWVLFLGTPGVGTRAALMGAGWVINLALAEWVIRRRAAQATRRVATAIA